MSPDFGAPLEDFGIEGLMNVPAYDVCKSKIHVPIVDDNESIFKVAVTVPSDEPYTKDSREFQNHFLHELKFVTSFFCCPKVMV